MSDQPYQSDTQQHTTLPTRIAAVLNHHKTDDRYDEWADCQCGHVGSRWDDHVADAVIAALGMRAEVDDKAAFRMEPSRHRFVTEWRTL